MGKCALLEVRVLAVAAGQPHCRAQPGSAGVKHPLKELIWLLGFVSLRFLSCLVVLTRKGVPVERTPAGDTQLSRGGQGIPPRSKQELLWAAQTLEVISASSGSCDRVTPSCLVGRRSWFLFTFLAKHTFAVRFVILGGCFCEWLRAPGFVPFKADFLSLES